MLEVLFVEELDETGEAIPRWLLGCCNVCSISLQLSHCVVRSEKSMRRDRRDRETDSRVTLCWWPVSYGPTMTKTVDEPAYIPLRSWFAS